mmetsp:Transcript_18491/g.29338  ORF Transcript_18491/g.29338 Transcript_18491/m.29338 type:complete len:305 (-) Transcript_18491:139-1053(-)
MRNAKRFVQIQMTDIGANLTWRGFRQLSLQIGAIHIDQAAMLVHHLAQVTDMILECAVRRGIRNHTRRQLLLILRRFQFELLHINVAIAVALDADNLVAAHGSRRRIRAVRTRRDQAHIALTLSIGDVVLANAQQASVLARGTAVWLQRDGIKSSDGGEPCLHILNERLIAFGLVVRRKRMHIVHRVPRHRTHRRRRIEFHSAAAERHHRSVEAEIFAFERIQVAHECRLRVIRVECGVLHEGAVASDRRWQRIKRIDLGEQILRRQSLFAVHRFQKHFKQAIDIRQRCCLVQRNRQMLVVNRT